MGDADEAKERRNRAGKNRRQSFGPNAGQLSTPTTATKGTVATPRGNTPGQGATGGTPVYSATQLAEHYTNCMKLSAENKINVKNAFQLRLIDYMAEMLKKKKSDMDNFQAASVALDASTKIYACRVDSVHTETLKLASGVGTSAANAQKNEDGGDAADGGEDGHDGEDDPRRKRKKRKRATMVEKNLNNINCGRFDLEFDVDPLFKKVSAQFDSGAGGGQFLANLRMKNDGCELMLDSNALAASARDAGLVDSQRERAALAVDRAQLPGSYSDLLICPTFSTFSFRDWSLEKEEELLSSQQDGVGNDGDPVGGLPEKDQHVFDPEAAAAAALEDGASDPDGDGIFGGDQYDDDDGDEGGAGGMPTAGAVTMAIMDVKTLRDHLSAVPTEYSYFDTGRLGAWAGPKHWKFKAFRRDKLASSEEERQKRQKNKEKEKVSFAKLDVKGDPVQMAVDKAMTVPKKAIKLQNKTIMNWSEEKNVLPEDMRYSGKDLVKLKGMTRSNVAPRRTSASQSVDDTVRDYDYDNPNDSQNFCPDLPADEQTGYQSATTMATAGDENVLGGSGIEGDIGLVAAPNKVEKIQIGYAKLAKKIDMRKLKHVEWEILNESMACAANKENSTQFNQSEASQVSTSSEGISASPTAERSTNFLDLYNTLRGPSQLPSKMKESLSVPLAFVALLHLCNEQVLELESYEELSNITIRKA